SKFAIVAWSSLLSIDGRAGGKVGVAGASPGVVADDVRHAAHVDPDRRQGTAGPRADGESLVAGAFLCVGARPHHLSHACGRQGPGDGIRIRRPRPFYWHDARRVSTER